MDKKEYRELLEQLSADPEFWRMVLSSAEKYERHELKIRASEAERQAIALGGMQCNLSEDWILKKDGDIWRMHKKDNEAWCYESYQFIDLWERYERYK